MTPNPTDTAAPRELTDAARGGDHDAFQTLMEPHRRELHAHCYRMLGSAHDAEDALQDTLLRAWRGLPGFAGRSSLRTWLFTITTNVCLAQIERRPRRPLPVDVASPSEPYDGSGQEDDAHWLGPYPDGHLPDGPIAPDARYEQRESVELAFVAAMQHLPATQRAVLILRDVLGLSAKETAAALDTSVPSVTSALQRARDTVQRRLPQRSQQATLRALGNRRLHEVVTAYVDAWERGDAQAILAMLADDATFSMPPAPVWYRGIDDIAAFLPAGPLREQWRMIPVRANGQVAFACYRWEAETRCYRASSLDVLTLRGSQVASITAFLTSSSVHLMGLPDVVPGPEPG